MTTMKARITLNDGSHLEQEFDRFVALAEQLDTLFEKTTLEDKVQRIEVRFHR